jgi:hypothetical protein
MFTEYLLGGLFFFGLVALISFAIYDSAKCNHEWEEHSVRVWDKRRNCSADALCLICKKCGKIKVIK